MTGVTGSVIVARVLSVAVTAAGVLADGSAVVAERYASFARWVAVATRCAP